MSLLEKDSATKADWFDSDNVLSKWGFTDSRCHCCGISNSDLDGLLMQCGKCKKAYYCSMKCFNKHLPVHNNYCVTKKIFSQPSKGSQLDTSPIQYEKKPISDLESFKKGPPISPKPQEPVEEPKEESEESAEIVEESESSLGEAEEEKEEDEHEEITELMSDSFRALGRSNGSIGPYLPGQEEFTREEVELRHAEMVKREIKWDKPDWALGSPLKKTPHGQKLKTKGDLASPVTNAATLLEKGAITWEKPEWTNPKLRPTRNSFVKRDSDLCGNKAEGDERLKHAPSL